MTAPHQDPHTQTIRKTLAAFTLAMMALSPAGAMGRRADNNADGFPDYNRLELHPKGPEIPADVPPAPPVRRPALTPAVSTAPVVEDLPRPLPRVVPVPDGASEPILPEDMMNTLVPSATQQNPAPAQAPHKSNKN